MTEPTHESDRKLWLDAHHHAPAFTLAPGVLLTDEQREWALEKVWENEEADNRERFEMKCR